jgi:hypothetical protein
MNKKGAFDQGKPYPVPEYIPEDDLKEINELFDEANQRMWIGLAFVVLISLIVGVTLVLWQN